MGNLKNNIDHYMKLKGIKMYTNIVMIFARTVHECSPLKSKIEKILKYCIVVILPL